MRKKDLTDLVSKTAKAGFQNEDDVVETFDNWKSNNSLGFEWRKYRV